LQRPDSIAARSHPSKEQASTVVAARRRSYELLADAFGLSGARDAEPELAHAQDIHDRSSHRE